MKKIKIVKAQSLVHDPTHATDPMDASRFHGYFSADGKRIGTVEHLYRRKAYRFIPDSGFKQLRPFTERTLRDLKAKLAEAC